MYELLPHTADIRIRVTGATLEELFVNAARGMMSVIRKDFEALEPDPKRKRMFRVSSLDHETLLIEFLSELLAAIDTENELYPTLTITELHERRLRAEAVGVHVDGFDEDVKAVTYQDMAITETPEGYETTITLDV
ncbi:archease [Candidatus Uhrbacteria bacterium]|nr:archease [Candidatus Uhrbacteria bacterium]